MLFRWSFHGFFTLSVFFGSVKHQGLTFSRTHPWRGKPSRGLPAQILGHMGNIGLIGRKAEGMLRLPKILGFSLAVLSRSFHLNTSLLTLDEKLSHRWNVFHRMPETRSHQRLRRKSPTSPMKVERTLWKELRKMTLRLFSLNNYIFQHTMPTQTFPPSNYPNVSIAKAFCHHLKMPHGPKCLA